MTPRLLPSANQSYTTASTTLYRPCIHARQFSRSPVRLVVDDPVARRRPRSGMQKHLPNAERHVEKAMLLDGLNKFLTVGAGAKLRMPLKGSTNYLNAYSKNGSLVRAERSKPGARKGLPPETESDLRPFPSNKHFVSQAVLSEELRTEIHRRVMELGAPVKMVSSSLGVSNERVAAVVRMKEIEKRWTDQGIPLATPYSRTILSMVPTTPLARNPKDQPLHEPINDIYVHPATKAQLFYPVSESRQFNRVDAGRAFENSFLPTEKRIPHPEMVTEHQWRLQGLPRDEVKQKMAEIFDSEQQAREQREQRKAAKEAREVITVAAGRWDYRFREINSERTGKDGRNPAAVGHRYGAPHQDRKKGFFRIPTRVLA